MPRNASGTMSLAAGNPVISGTTITSTWANATLPDIATEITDSLDRSGKGGMLAQFKAFDGTSAAPGVSWANELDSGIFRNASQDFQFQVNAATIQVWRPTGSVFPKGLSATGLTAGTTGVVGVGGPSNGTGVIGTGGASNGVGVRGVGTAAGAGVEAVGADGYGVNAQGGTDSAGVLGFGGPTNGEGVIGAGAGAGQGGLFTGGSSGDGVDATAGASGSFGVRASGGAGGAVGVYGVGGDTGGSGVAADTQSDTAAFRIGPQAAPTTATHSVGHMYVSAAGKLMICTVAGTPGTFVVVGTQT